MGERVEKAEGGGGQGNGILPSLTPGLHTLWC